MRSIAWILAAIGSTLILAMAVSIAVGTDVDKSRIIGPICLLVIGVLMLRAERD